MNALTTAVIISLSILCPVPHVDALREIDAAESWQVALFAAELPIGHAAHWDALERASYWQWEAWATCPGVLDGERASWLGWVWAARFEHWIRR